MQSTCVDFGASIDGKTYGLHYTYEPLPRLYTCQCHPRATTVARDAVLGGKTRSIATSFTHWTHCVDTQSLRASHHGLPIVHALMMSPFMYGACTAQE